MDSKASIRPGREEEVAHHSSVVPCDERKRRCIDGVQNSVAYFHTQNAVPERPLRRVVPGGEGDPAEDRSGVEDRLCQGGVPTYGIFALHADSVRNAHRASGHIVDCGHRADSTRDLRIFVHDGAVLDMRAGSDTSATVLRLLASIASPFWKGPGCCWWCNIFDAAVHEIVVNGEGRPRSEPIVLGVRAWIGTGSTILPGCMSASTPSSWQEASLRPMLRPGHWLVVIRLG